MLAVGGCDVRVVLEMTDSVQRGWTEYFDEAERNRGATASLGLVRTVEQNAQQSIRVLGGRRIAMAFDPEVDDPDLLRTVVMLLRTAATAAASRRPGAGDRRGEARRGARLPDQGRRCQDDLRTDRQRCREGRAPGVQRRHNDPPLAD